MREFELVIVGAGPAGIAAAVEAEKAGIGVAVLDEQARPGGQVFRQPPEGLEITGEDTRSRKSPGAGLLREFEQSRDRFDYCCHTLVWGIFPNSSEVACLHDRKSYSIRYRKLFLAAGAYERPVPFPGWTLPGVMTSGGAQHLIKSQGVLPGENILLAGTGPLQLALASQILAAGGRVAAILEASDIHNWPRLMRAAFGHWGLLSEAARYLLAITKAGIPLLRRHVLIEARGNGEVQEAVIAEVDRDWRYKPGSQKTLKVDAVCVGYGFVPSTELSRLATCEHRFEAESGGWVPVRNACMETSIAGIYCAGDCSGVGGRLVAVEEGRIAGISVAQSLGRLSAQQAARLTQPCLRRLKRMARLRRELDRISLPGPGLHELARSDTPICRCQDVTLGEIQEAIMRGVNDLNELKRMTRIGMGQCQGRMCGPGLQSILVGRQGAPPQVVHYLNSRPPVRPLPLKSLAEHTS